MPRQSKPFFREQTKSWYCSIHGKQFPLGKNKAEAFDKFYELVGRKDDLRSESSTVYDLTQSYLDWCERNRKPGTYENHLKYLKSLIESIGKRLRVGEIRKHHLTKWLEDNRPLRRVQPAGVCGLYAFRISLIKSCPPRRTRIISIAWSRSI